MFLHVFVIPDCNSLQHVIQQCPLMQLPRFSFVWSSFVPQRCHCTVFVSSANRAFVAWLQATRVERSALDRSCLLEFSARLKSLIIPRFLCCIQLSLERIPTTTERSDTEQYTRYARSRRTRLSTRCEEMLEHRKHEHIVDEDG